MAMHIVIGTLALEQPGGTETYCLTIARELERLGHDVTIVASALGAMADHIAAEGLDVATSFAELPSCCDAILANDAISAGLLRERYPDNRIVYALHSSRFEVQTPPFEADVVQAIVVGSERFARHARSLALDAQVIRLTQPIDILRFVPSTPPRSTPQRALIVSNYLEGPRLDALLQTWEALGLECSLLGHSFGDKGRVTLDVRDEIVGADIVVAKARAALEAMACGKAVYVFDAFGGDGWVTPDSYPAMEADNFGGLSSPFPVDRSRLEADLKEYDADMGWVNRDLVALHHDAREHVVKLLEVLRGPSPTRVVAGSNPGAVARSLRNSWLTQRRGEQAMREAAEAVELASQLRSELAAARDELRSQAQVLEAAGVANEALSHEFRVEAERRYEELERLFEQEVAELRAQVTALQAETGCIAAECDALRTHANTVDEELDAANGLLASRRVRWALWLGRHYDQLRTRS